MNNYLAVAVATATAHNRTLGHGNLELEQGCNVFETAIGDLRGMF